AHDYVMKDKLARLGPAVERELREAEVRHQRRRTEESLKVEHAITRIMANANSFDEASPGIVQLLIDGLEVDFGALWMLDSKRQLLEPFVLNLRETSPLFKTFLEQSRRLSLSLGSGLPGAVWAQRRAAWISDLSQESILERRDAALNAGF